MYTMKFSGDMRLTQVYNDIQWEILFYSYSSYTGPHDYTAVCTKCIV